jgi:ketosteroid isomerase-like protein
VTQLDATIEDEGMSELDEFLAAAMPRLTEAETALLNGDPALRIEMWSHEEPVTLFGAVTTETGWPHVRGVFEWLGSSFSDCTYYRNEVLAAGASGDLAYIVALEHKTVTLDDAPRTYTLRVTTVFRREGGEWKIVHRHGDPGPSESADESLKALPTATG